MPPVDDVDDTARDHDVLKEQARRRRIGFFGLTRSLSSQLGKIESAVGSDNEIDQGFVQSDLAKGPGPSKQAAQFEVDQQAFESPNRCSLRFGEFEIVGLKFEQKRVDAHLADMGVTLQPVLRDLGHIMSDQIGGKKKTAQRIENQKSNDDNKRLAEKYAPQFRCQSWFCRHPSTPILKGPARNNST